MYFSLMLGRVMLTCDTFVFVFSSSTPKGGYRSQPYACFHIENNISNNSDFCIQKIGGPIQKMALPWSVA